jgi:diaminohydroxyphosphoribosylaminopyrimidine deaminase/5-amino-6-(5-phosphoribosylamino)uracil reductase
MLRALALAKQGQGRVEPNPMVGAVVVRDGVIVGEGYHQLFGGPHAEVHALQQAGDAARRATIYVTLEPCSHTGKTPPCLDAIIQAGVKKVVAAVTDPFPAVSGTGFQRLRDAGIEVVVGVEEVAATRLNAPFFKLIKTGTPYVIAKWAMTLDGKIATKTGDSKWISSEASRARVHELRGMVDAIVVGIGTVLADDPLLTARPSGPRQACRVVLDRQLRIPLDCQLVTTCKEAPLLVVHQGGDAEKQHQLTQRGCELLPIPECGSAGMVQRFLAEAGQRRWTNILVEGGGRLLGSFFDAQAVDETWVFLASKTIGGEAASGPVGGDGVNFIKDAVHFEYEEVTRLQSDVFLRAIRQQIQ